MFSLSWQIREAFCFFCLADLGINGAKANRQRQALPLSPPTSAKTEPTSPTMLLHVYLSCAHTARGLRNVNSDSLCPSYFSSQHSRAHSRSLSADTPSLPAVKSWAIFFFRGIQTIGRAWVPFQLRNRSLLLSSGVTINSTLPHRTQGRRGPIRLRSMIQTNNPEYPNLSLKQASFTLDLIRPEQADGRTITVRIQLCEILESSWLEPLDWNVHVIDERATTAESQWRRIITPVDKLEAVVIATDRRRSDLVEIHWVQGVFALYSYLSFRSKFVFFSDTSNFDRAGFDFRRH